MRIVRVFMFMCPKKFLRKSSTGTRALGSVNFHEGEGFWRDNKRKKS
jgi:hypothetical protein